MTTVIEPTSYTASSSNRSANGSPTRIVIADPSLHHIVIVGGGAAGLELATKLGDSLGRRRTAQITLVERTRTHIWKPHLHEESMQNRGGDYAAAAVALWSSFAGRKPG